MIIPPPNGAGPHTSQQRLFSEEWTEFFGTNVELDQLERCCIEGRLRGSRIRSILWRIFLRCLPMDRREWAAILSRNRARYGQLKAQAIVNPHCVEALTMDLELSNPLSQDKQSPWKQYFEDCELREFIDKDVKRTFCEVQFFRNEITRKQLSDILFVYAKCNSHIAYKQGMHEILAPLLFVIYLDIQSFGHLVEQNGLSDLTQSDVALLRMVFDPVFLENDAFDMFSQLMMLLESWYLPAEEATLKPALVPISVDGIVESFSKNGDAAPNSELLRKLYFIGENILAQVDPPLYTHLTKLEIHPQLYGIRWLRLLFGREFPLHDVLYIWDAIFACRPILSLADYLFVAFLEQIRHLLIRSDYTTCLQYLMRYPPIVDAYAFLQLALHIKSPKKYAKPRMPGVTNFTDITVAGIPHPNKERFEVTTSPRALENPSRPEDIQNGETSQNKKLRESFMGKIVDTLTERRHSGSQTNSLFRPSSSSMNELSLLKEQVACLQSRLNTVSLVAKIVSKRVDGCIADVQQLDGNKEVQERLESELLDISDQLTRSTVSEEWVRNVTIPDATCERGGVELAREADNLRSPLARPPRNSDRELVDIKQDAKQVAKRQKCLR